MRILNGIFIAVFLAMLTLPLIFVDLSSDRVSVQENRMLERRPPLSYIKNHPGTFVRGFDAWFKDSTGFRERLVTLYNFMGKNRWLNSIWYIDGQYTYLIGEEGHHYFAHIGGFLISKFQGKQFLTDDVLTNMVDKLEEAKTYLDKQGIPLIVMFCADKESIYPEFYPKSIKRGPEPIQLDMITGYLQEHTTVDIFNIRQALLREKDIFLLYNVCPPNEIAHYNEIGAFFAYRELMRHINIYFPEIIPYELDDVDISYDKNGIPAVSLKTGTTYKLDHYFIDVNTEYIAAYENMEPSLSTILVFHDSYANENFIRKYIAQNFNKAVFIHWISIAHFEEYIDRYKPDIVVFESAELQLQAFANSVAGIPKLP